MCVCVHLQVTISKTFFTDVDDCLPLDSTSSNELAQEGRLVM